MAEQLLISNKSHIFSIGVFIEFKGNRLNSSSVVLLTDIGEQPAGPTSEPDTVRGDALVCVTDFPTCCRVADGSAGTTGVGRWLFPGGDEVPGIGGSVPHMGIYRNRGTSLVRLNRQADSPQMTAGEYCCEIPDRFGDTQNVCVNVGELSPLTPDMALGSKISFESRFSVYMDLLNSPICKDFEHKRVDGLIVEVGLM